jgi:hypothetical protein
MITSPRQVENFYGCFAHYLVVDFGFQIERSIFCKLYGHIAWQVGTHHNAIRTDGRDHPSNIFAEAPRRLKIEVLAD